MDTERRYHVSIGITQWRGSDSTYPLPSSVFVGVFSDAAFMLFDTETPYLNTITVGVNVVFEFIFIAGTSTYFSIPIASCVADYTLPLRDNTRYYGSLTFGEQLASLIGNYSGNTIPVAQSFHLNTVRYINSQSGLFSVQGQTGNVVVTYDTNILPNLLTGTNLSAVSMPNYLKTYTSLSTQLFIFDSAFQTMVLLGDTSNSNILNPNAGLNISISTVSANPPSLSYISSQLIGVATDETNSYIYDCSIYPWKLLQTVSGEAIKEVAQVGTSLYALLTNGSLYNLGSAPYNSSSLVTVKYNGVARNLSLSHILAAPGSPPYLMATGGGQHGYSDTYYSIDSSGNATALGMFTTTTGVNKFKDAPCIMVTAGSYNNAPAIFANSGQTLYAMPLNNFNPASPISVAALPAAYTLPAALVAGGWTIQFNTVVPLVSINGEQMSSIKIIGDPIITINNTGQDTINIGMLIPDSSANIQRTQQYG